MSCEKTVRPVFIHHCSAFRLRALQYSSGVLDFKSFLTKTRASG
jgi:hypothetical protein